jgi:hypothetical protein
MHLNLLKLGHMLLQSKLQSKNFMKKGQEHAFKEILCLSEFLSMYSMDFYSLEEFDFTRTKINELVNDVKMIDEVSLL